MRRLKHWPLRTPISISAMFSQLACLGVKWNSSRRRRRCASSAGKASWSAPGVWVERLSSTTRTRSACGWSTSTSSRMHRAKSRAVRCWVTVTLRQGRGADSRGKRNGSSEADLHVLAKLGEQRLERGEEAEALPRRQVVAEDDLLQLGVAHGVEVPRQVAA